MESFVYGEYKVKKLDHFIALRLINFFSENRIIFTH